MAADAAEATLNDALTQLAAYVSNIAKGDATIIMSAGMEVSSSASPVQPVDAPVVQSIANGAMPGTMTLKWKRVSGAKSFSVEKCLDPVTPDGWSNGDTATKVTATVSGLMPGKLYWLRVAGVGAMGKGPFSEPMSRWAI